MVALSARLFLIANLALFASATFIPRAPAGTQFITGPCQSDADCASGCCGFRTGKCAGAVIAQERDGGCGFGDGAPNNRAAQALQGPNAAAAPGVAQGGAAPAPATGGGAAAAPQRSGGGGAAPQRGGGGRRPQQPAGGAPAQRPQGGRGGGRNRPN